MEGSEILKIFHGDLIIQNTLPSPNILTTLKYSDIII